MNVSIIVFSPSGHTLKVAKMIEKSFEGKDSRVRLINITGKEELLYGDRKKEILDRELGEYDVLFIGGPVYAGHIEHHVLNCIEALPLPDKTHSNLAVPFVTYGGVHSSIALEEMGKSLKRQKYTPILGIKLAAKHTLTTTLSNIINADRPGPEEETVIAEAVERIVTIVRAGRKAATDQSKSLKYASAKERVMYRIFSQEMIHKKFKNVAVRADKCVKCKRCISVCPVDMFRYSDGVISINRDKDSCILCAECFHNCPVGAIEHPYIEMGRKRLEDGFIELEEVQSAIYPAI